jgi:MoaA/NifB/PqqE/SkfB family radical SAM enzyme/uncharacterized RmlC-like cupin family protein
MIEPKSICIDASTVCQLKCPSCPTANGKTGKTLGRGFLKFSDFKDLVDDNPEIYDIELSNWGEIFLNKDLLEIIRYAFRKGIKLSAKNGSNMNYLDKEIPEALVRYKFRIITCSIDGASQKTYSIYRVNGNFEQAISNIKKINFFKKKYNSYHPVLQWQFIAFGHNDHEIDKARKMAEELNMSFKVKLSWDDLYTDTFSPVKNTERIRKETSTGVANREEYRAKYGIDYVSRCCLRLWNKPRINYDGKLLGCSINYWGDYGNVFNNNLLEKMNGEKINYAREILMGRRKATPDIPCSNCKVYNNRRKYKNWVTEEDIEKALAVYDENRKLTLLKNRLLRFSTVNRMIGVDHKKIKKIDPIPKKMKASNIYKLNLPITIPGFKKWKHNPLFKGITGNHMEISCHASALASGNSPHRPHKHREEELLLLLSGNARLILPDNKKGDMDLSEGKFVYYPSFFPHTLRTTSIEPANYLMLRWTTKINNENPQMFFNHFDILEEQEVLNSRLVFEGSTTYLQRLHCHRTVLKPYKGYDPHVDNYDIVIMILEGEVETIESRAKANDVIFYASGEPHGVYNPTDKPASYIVFEFHTKKLPLIKKISDSLEYSLQRYVMPEFWKNILKRIYVP